MSYMKYPAVQNVYIDPMATTHIGGVFFIATTLWVYK